MDDFLAINPSWATYSLNSFGLRSLTNFFDVYNQCEIRPLPYIKYGISFAYGMIRMVKPPLHEDMLIPTPTWRVFLDQMDHKYKSSYTLGLFLDNPIFRKNYSLHTELNYTYIKSAYSQNINGNGIELAIDYSALSMPLMVRYTLPHKTIQPFINGGAHYSVFLTNTSSYLINGTLIGNNVLMARHSIGYSLGSGLEYRLKYSKSLFLEFRYTKLYGLSKSESFRRSELQLFTGINF